MRHTLAAALLVGGQYSRAAHSSRRPGRSTGEHLGAADPEALDCAYQAGTPTRRPESQTRRSPSSATTS